MHHTVDKHVSGGGRKGGSHAIEFSSKPNLTPKSACVSKPECHIQHVVLIILRLWKKVVMLRRENNVARGAGHRAFTSTYHMRKLVKLINSR